MSESESESDNESYESVEESIMSKPTLQRQQEQPPQVKPKKQLSEKQKEAFAKGRLKRQENLKNAKKEKLELENYKKKDTIKEYNQPEELEQTLLKKYEPRKKTQPEIISRPKQNTERPPTPPQRQPIQKDNTLKQRKEALA